MLDFFWVHSQFQVVVARPVSELIARFGDADQLRRLLNTHSDAGYEGKATTSGFTLRRIVTHPKDTKGAVVIRRWFQPEHEETVVRVVIRHGRHLIAFSWLLLFVSICALIGAATGTAGNTDRGFGWAGFFILPAFALLLHYRLYRDVQKVSGEVRSMLTGSWPAYSSSGK